jgi:hypothetical protein
MSRTKRLQIRISPELKEKVEKIASERNISVSELIVDYIKRLPNPKVLLAILASATIAAKNLSMPLRACMETPAPSIVLDCPHAHHSWWQWSCWFRCRTNAIIAR